jgi:hypothetical protein
MTLSFDILGSTDRGLLAIHMSEPLFRRSQRDDRGHISNAKITTEYNVSVRTIRVLQFSLVKFLPTLPWQ